MLQHYRIVALSLFSVVLIASVYAQTFTLQARDAFPCKVCGPNQFASLGKATLTLSTSGTLLLKIADVQIDTAVTIGNTKSQTAEKIRFDIATSCDPDTPLSLSTPVDFCSVALKSSGTSACPIKPPKLSTQKDKKAPKKKKNVGKKGKKKGHSDDEEEEEHEQPNDTVEVRLEAAIASILAVDEMKSNPGPFILTAYKFLGASPEKGRVVGCFQLKFTLCPGTSTTPCTRMCPAGNAELLGRCRDTIGFLSDPNEKCKLQCCPKPAHSMTTMMD